MFSESVWSILGMLAVVIAILVLAYYATKWIGSYSAKSATGRARPVGNGEFCVLAQLNVGRGERLLLVRVQDKCCLLGVTANNITLLRELSEEEAGAWLAEPEPAPGLSFKDVLIENLRKKK